MHVLDALPGSNFQFRQHLELLGKQNITAGTASGRAINFCSASAMSYWVRAAVEAAVFLGKLLYSYDATI